MLMTNELEDQMIAKTEGYLSAKKNTQAVQSANELAETDPKDAIVWFVKGKAHYLSGQYDDALSSLAKAATLQAEQSDIWLAMGYTLIALRRYAEAQPSLEYVLGVKPDSVEAACALCVLHTILGNAEAAKGYLQQGQQINAPLTSSILSRFNEDFFASSPGVSAASKTAINDLVKGLR